jgi:polyhydroxyalkanoate synthesis regulator phasin
MPDVLTRQRPLPPANDAPLNEGGGQHSQAWVRYFQAVSDELGTIAGTFVALRADLATARARVDALEARIAALEGP